MPAHHPGPPLPGHRQACSCNPVRHECVSLGVCRTGYKELASVDRVRNAPTPFVDVQCSETPSVGKTIPESTMVHTGGEVLTANPTPGRHGPIASRVLMKILYAARMARPDLLKAVNSLACMVTKWDSSVRRATVALGRIRADGGTTLSVPVGWRPHASNGRSTLYADADFAGCQETARSTSGVFLCVRGPDTFVPLSGASRRQRCVSHSTPEAKIVARQ
jgi:hypothetical protein